MASDMLVALARATPDRTTLFGHNSNGRRGEGATLVQTPGREHAPGEWQVAATALPRLRIAGRLMQDLGINVSGAALALELIEAQRELEKRLHRLERLLADY